MYVDWLCVLVLWPGLYIVVQGKISFNNLKRVAKELGENLTDEELQVQAYMKWWTILF